MVSDSSNHSLYLIIQRETAEKGRFACRCRYQPPRKFLRTLPCRPAFTRHRLFPPHGRKPRNPTEIRAQDVVCQCACVWQGMAGQEREERRGNKEANHLNTGQKWMKQLAKNMMKIAWENTKQHKKHWETCQNKGSFLGTM